MKRPPEEKVIDYMRLYGASEIMVGRRTGRYPCARPDFAMLEQRALADAK